MQDNTSASPSSPQAVSAVPVGMPSAADLERLESAAKALLAACQLADAHEDLSEFVDGSLMDALSDALEWRYPEIWTDEQVEALNASQNGYGHPFTCGSGNRGDAIHAAQAEEDGTDRGQLVATRRGWICPALGCDYRQFWAHPHQFKGARQNPLEAMWAAQAIEARSAETEGLGPKDESGGGEANRQTTQGNPHDR